jgi:hypothetical protein
MAGEMTEHQMRRRPKVFERDIDELLERKLRTDSEFRKKLVAKIAGPDIAPFVHETIQIDRQVRHEGTTGTIDLLLRLLDGRSEEVSRILIENKVDASFTPGQPERYASSAVAMSRTGRMCIAVICAPGVYLQKSKYLGPFKTRIAYEDITAWLEGEDRSLLEAAILRFLMPYEPDPVPAVRDFHEGYVSLVRERTPELIVKRNPNTAGERPEASRTIYFDVRKVLPQWSFLPTLRFSHQCWDSSAPAPSVKIMFDRWAPYESLLRKRAVPVLGNTRFYLRKAGRSLGLVCDTPRMDNKSSVSVQMDAVLAGLSAAQALRAWMYANEASLSDWASAVTSEQQRHL